MLSVNQAIKIMCHYQINTTSLHTCQKGDARSATGGIIHFYVAWKCLRDIRKDVAKNCAKRQTRRKSNCKL